MNYEMTLLTVAVSLLGVVGQVAYQFGLSKGRLETLNKFTLLSHRKAAQVTTLVTCPTCGTVMNIP